MVLGLPDIHLPKNDIGSLPHIINIRTETIELLEEHIGASLHDLDLAKRFLDMTVCAIIGKNR